MEREFFIDVPEMGGILRKKKNWKLKDLIESYKIAYCGKIGVEYMHISDRDTCNWIRDAFEGLQFETVPKSERIVNLDRILWAEMFGTFLE